MLISNTSGCRLFGKMNLRLWLLDWPAIAFAVVPVDRSRVYTTGFSNVRCVRLCLLVSTSNTEPGGLWLWTHAGRLHELSPWL
eukprot:COSAG01_NODE_3181_length_6453_cov_7.178155_11_plen_83_part_00